jgi:hypothetical protein
VRAIVQSAQDTVGRKRIVPARTKSWWCTAIEEAIDKRRELHAAWLKQPTRSSRRAWETALKAFKATRKCCQEEYFKQQADDLNEIYHQKVNEQHER